MRNAFLKPSHKNRERKHTHALTHPKKKVGNMEHPELFKIPFTSTGSMTTREKCSVAKNTGQVYTKNKTD